MLYVLHVSGPWTEPTIEEKGIIIPPPIDPGLGKWERQSLPLMVSVPYRELFDEFSQYFEDEMDAIGDDTIDQELEILKNLGK